MKTWSQKVDTSRFYLRTFPLVFDVPSLAAGEGFSIDSVSGDDQTTMKEGNMMRFAMQGDLFVNRKPTRAWEGTFERFSGLPNETEDRSSLGLRVVGNVRLPPGVGRCKGQHQVQPRAALPGVLLGVALGHRHPAGLFHRGVPHQPGFFHHPCRLHRRGASDCWRRTAESVHLCRQGRCVLYGKWRGRNGRCRANIQNVERRKNGEMGEHENQKTVAGT